MLKHFRVPGGLRTKLEEFGVNVPAVLRAAGLPQDLFQQTRILVTTEEQFALWRAIGGVSNDPSIGLKLGTESKTERFHPMGIAALSTDDFGAALRHMARYKKLTAPEEISAEVKGNEWAIQFRWSLAVETEPPVLIEHCFAWVLTIARKGTGKNLSPLRVEFVQPRPHVRELKRHFGCPIVCGAARNALVFRTTDAELPFLTQNAELLEMLAPQFEQELKQRSANNKDNFLEMVRGPFSRGSRDIAPQLKTSRAICI
jgi:Arabinose-binding domain of AraC transcription regulator, N-term